MRNVWFAYGFAPYTPPEAQHGKRLILGLAGGRGFNLAPWGQKIQRLKIITWAGVRQARGQVLAGLRFPERH